MRLSHLFARTLREDPAEADAASHRLLMRAAFIRQVMAGVYTTLPLGLRTVRKIEAIVREEMDACGAQELRMPILLPSDPWKATGRWEAYGDEMFKLTDRHGREVGLGPTQEEVVAPLVAGELPSYRDLPVNLYQIEWKYRDERRPRYGLLRGREFLMKDAYSFDVDEDAMRRSYDVMLQAYHRVFARCGLDYLVVEADPGSIGGDVNHEFMAPAEIGEDLYVTCENGDYLADLEAASQHLPEAASVDEPAKSEDVATPGATSVAAVARLLEVPESQILKTMLFDAGGQAVAVLVPGDREVNEKKLARLYSPSQVRAFDEDAFEAHGLVRGFVGPQGLGQEIAILADRLVSGAGNWVAGANRPDHHTVGVNVTRDFRVDRYEDLVQISEGDRCPNDGGALRIGSSIVVGHIYQLGTLYSEPLKATFADEDGIEHPYQMACYGIGISRIVAAAAEQFHDDDGLTWPKALAPFEVCVVLATRDHEPSVAQAEAIYEGLSERGVEVVLDDRAESAGVKFKDADLIGYPVQVVVGKRGIEAGTIDVKARRSGERTTAPLAAAVDAASRALQAAP
ncbi:MAG: proline--tRNA ligase [Actinomycetota bacterium]